MKVPEGAKWAIGIAALVLLPQNTTWPTFLVETSDYYAEMRLTTDLTVVVAKNSGSRSILLDSYDRSLHVVRGMAGGDPVQVLDGKIPAEAYSVLVAPVAARLPEYVKQGDELVRPGELRIFTPAEMTHYAVTIVILVGMAVALALLVRDFRDEAGV